MNHDDGNVNAAAPLPHSSSAVPSSQFQTPSAPRQYGYGPPARHDQKPVAPVARIPPPRPPPPVGIRVAINLDHQISPPPPMVPQKENVSQSKFQFDFDLEKKILQEAEKWDMKLDENEKRSGAIVDDPSPTSCSSNSTVVQVGGGGDEADHEIMTLAILNYGENSKKIQKFVEGHKLLVEMGFASNRVIDALLMSDNDTDKASAHLLDNSS